MWDLPRWYISACSNSVQYVRLHPILMSILLYHYKQLTVCISEVQRIEGRESTTLLAVHHYWVSAHGGNSGVLPLASLLSQRVTLDFLMIENRKKFFTLLQHLDLFLGLRSSLLVASLLLHPSQRMVLRWRPSYLKRAYL